MSRVSNALDMYFMILGRNIISVEEIARELEVTERMVKEYKVDLEKAGIYIGSKRGRYGGYYLETKKGLEGIGLTQEELNVLQMVKETIKSGNYHYKNKFEIIVNKLIEKQDELESLNYYNKTLVESNHIIEKEKRVWSDINLSINKKNKISIKYKSLKEKRIEVEDRIVHPYGIFDYKGATYFYAYCEKRKDIRFFKLSRIVDYKVLNEKFKIKIDFDFDDVKEKSFGIFNDEEIHLKLKISYPMNEIVREKQIIGTQKITDIDEKTICFEAKIKGYKEIKTWIMSMGSCVEVIEPKKLKEDIINEIKNMSNIYEKS